jgi:hypothetical protein
MSRLWPQYALHSVCAFHLGRGPPQATRHSQLVFQFCLQTVGLCVLLWEPCQKWTGGRVRQQSTVLTLTRYQETFPPPACRPRHRDPEFTREILTHYVSAFMATRGTFGRGEMPKLSRGISEDEQVGMSCGGFHFRGW